MTTPARTVNDVLPRGLIVVLGLTGLLVTTLALQQFAAILAPVLLALVLVIGVHPLTGMLRHHGAPQWLAVTVTLIALVVVIVGLTAAFAISLAELGTILPTYQDRFAALLGNLRDWLASFGIGPDQLQAALGSISFANLAGIVTGLLGALAGAFSNLLFLVFVVLFMGLDAGQFSRRLTLAGSHRAAVVTALGGFVRGTRSYLVVSTVFGLIVAVIDAGILWILGVPIPAVLFHQSPTIAVAVGAGAGMAASTRMLFSPVLFAALLIGAGSHDAVPAAVLGSVAAWLTAMALQRTTTPEEAGAH